MQNIPELTAEPGFGVRRRKTVLSSLRDVSRMPHGYNGHMARGKKEKSVCPRNLLAINLNRQDTKVIEGGDILSSDEHSIALIFQLGGAHTLPRTVFAGRGG